MGSLPAETSLDEVLLRIKKTTSNPRIGKVAQVQLKSGPQAFRIATLFEILDGPGGQFHHYSLRIDQVNHTSKAWFSKPEKSVVLNGDEPNEIEILCRFLEAAGKDKLGDATGELHLVRGEDYAKLERLLSALPTLVDPDKIQLAKAVLAQLDGASSNTKEFVEAFQGSSEEVLGHIAAASRLVNYKKALQKLRVMVADSSTSEGAFQKHLEQNPWLFGSEYSQLVPRRTWTRDDKLDFMLRRTADNYVEIVEIKTAFSEPLFIHEEGRDAHRPSAKLSQVLGQVMRYIEEVESNRLAIIHSDDVDPLKIRARAILGRDSDEGSQKALRNLNGHLNRIEVLTFDQLIRIGERVVAIFEPPSASPDVEEFDDDIPF